MKRRTRAETAKESEVELRWLFRDSDRDSGAAGSVDLGGTPGSATAACTAGPTAAQLAAARRASDMRRALVRIGPVKRGLLTECFTPRSLPPDKVRDWGLVAGAVCAVERASGACSNADAERIRARVASALASFGAERELQAAERRAAAADHRRAADEKAKAWGDHVRALGTARERAPVRRVVAAMMALAGLLIGKREGSRDDVDG